MLKAQEVVDGVCLRLNCCGKAYYDAETQTRADGWKRWFLMTVDALIQAALAGGGRDNVSVVVVFVN
jgi:serine/threonine protein phosphatase PrpC